MRTLRITWWLVGIGCGVAAAWGQLDPVKRELIQLGYNQPMEGRGPFAGYAFYYLNQPFTNTSHTNLTLRLAVAPVYVDSELGIRQALGRRTDLGIGLAGGGFADNYYEVRRGRYLREESFLGHGGEVSASLYHCFNPTDTIPLNAVLRTALHGSVFDEDDHTARAFALPDNQVALRVRSGLRWGGREPVMLPEMAMEVSGWYEGSFRSAPGHYGLDRSRMLEPHSHLFWGRALLSYTFPKLKHRAGVNVTGGIGADVDRFSAYRLGGHLPLYSEFPLTLPGYFFQELSAKSFVLFGGDYTVPLDSRKSWHVGMTVATAYVDYLPGLEQPNQWNTGAGVGVWYRSPTGSWHVGLAYGYGFDAMRDHGRGAQSITFLLQFDLGSTRQRIYDPSLEVGRSRGFQYLLRNIFQ